MRSIFKKVPGSSAGLSLIEIVLAMGILSVIALGTATMTSQGMKGANNVRLLADFSGLRSMAATALGDMKNCPNALRNGGAVISYPGGNVNLTRITSNNGNNEVMAINKDYNGYRITSMQVQLLNQFAPNPVAAKLPDPANVYQNYQKYITQLSITATKQLPPAGMERNSLGSSTMTATIPLVLITGPNGSSSIYRCMVQDPDYEALCDSMGGKFDPTQTPSCLISRLGVSDTYADRDTNVALLPGNIGIYTKGNILSLGNAGIGTLTPRSRLDVNGGLAVGSYAGTTAAPANGVIVSGRMGVGNVAPTNPLSVTGNGDFSGRVGVGTAAPVNSLSVVGNADFTGNVGVGTAAPAAKLDVAVGKIWMQSRTQDADPPQTVVTKDWAIRNLFASKGLCPARYVMLGFDANGSRVCAPTDAITTNQCPAGDYLVGYDATGTKVCRSLSNIGSCGYRQYMAGVDLAGNKICKTLFETGVCPAGQTLRGFDGSGNPVCTDKANGGTCPAGQAVVSVGTGGGITCAPKAAGGSCAVGQVVTGINTNGSPICSSTSSLDVITRVGPTASCDSRAGYPCASSTATCDAGYTAVGGGLEWLGDYSCSEKYRFTTVSQPSGTTGWTVTMVCSTFRAWVVCAR
jgi:hypothetical protein